MTGLSVYSLISTAKNWGLDKKITDFLNQVVVIARSSKPKEALAKHGIKTDIVPIENTTEGIVKLLENYNMINKKVSDHMAWFLFSNLRILSHSSLERWSLNTELSDSLDVKENEANLLKRWVSTQIFLRLRRR